MLLAFRLISVVTWIALGLSLIYFLFDSNLLTSKLEASEVSDEQIRALGTPLRSNRTNRPMCFIGSGSAILSK